jgi:hypothetical protein
MTQIEFSNSIKDYLTQHHSEFLPSINFKEDGSFDCHSPSKMGKLSIWLATYFLEITVGFEDNKGNSDSHWHLGRVEEAELPELLADTSRFITDIIYDKILIVQREKTGYHIYKNLEEALKDKSKNATMGVYKWSEL